MSEIAVFGNGFGRSKFNDRRNPARSRVYVDDGVG